MKANKLIPLVWILISLLFTIHTQAQYPDGQETGTTHYIVGYEYAFNQGEGITYVPITPTTDFNLLTDIDVSNLTHDVNVFHIRFKDDLGKWSSMLSQIFIKPPEVDSGTDAKIVGYEYAFNDGEGQTYVPITPTADYNLLSDVDVSGLEHDVNVFHVRFKDDLGKWSSMLSYIFIKPPETNSGADTNIVGYEYALNNESYEYTSITPTTDYNLITDIDVSALTGAINTIQIRFKDDKGKWSSMLNYLFIKPPTSETLTDNKLISYEYWFDNDMTTKRSVDINPDEVDFLVQELDMTHIWRGEHTMQTQYKDTYGKYSLVMTDTIIKNSFPIAAFDIDNTGVCLGESISFTDAGSIDYDTFVYDFGDGETSTDFNVEHTYAAVGVYDASLTVTDTNTGVDSVLVKTITVRDYPNNNVQITGEIPACYGNIITLTAEETDASYLWSNGETTQSINITETGNFFVEISFNTEPSCTVQSDTIEVIFNPEIDNTVTLQDYPLLLIANQTNATYQWIDCTNGDIPITGATSSSYEPTVNGDYAVQITQNECTVTSDCITIGTVSVADYAIKQLVHLYPNPVNDVLQIEADVPVFIRLYNINGMLVREMSSSIGTESINLSELSSGLYFAKVTVLSGEWINSSTTYKFIKD
jgi:PKD repeat protein